MGMCNCGNFLISCWIYIIGYRLMADLFCSVSVIFCYFLVMAYGSDVFSPNGTSAFHTCYPSPHPPPPPTHTHTHTHTYTHTHKHKLFSQAVIYYFYVPWMYLRYCTAINLFPVRWWLNNVMSPGLGLEGVCLSVFFSPLLLVSSAVQCYRLKSSIHFSSDFCYWKYIYFRRLLFNVRIDGPRTFC